MKKIFASISVAILLLVFVVYSQSGKSEQLTLTLDLAKDRVILMEPIPFRLTLENRTSSPLRQNKPLDLERIKLTIEKPNGKIVKPKQLTNTISQIYGGTGEMRPGARSEIKEILQYDLLKWFDQPGQYRLRITFLNGDSELSTEWVTLTVDEPKGADISAFERLRGSITESNMVLSTPPKVREELLEQFPESPYAVYMRYSLAQFYESRDRKKSIELYERLQVYPGFFFADEVNKRAKSLEQQERIKPSSQAKEN